MRGGELCFQLPARQYENKIERAWMSLGTHVLMEEAMVIQGVLKGYSGALDDWSVGWSVGRLVNRSVGPSSSPCVFVCVLV